MLCDCSAPDKPIRPFAIIKPTIFVLSTLIDDALTISGLSPVALMQSPKWVLKNQITNRITTKAIIKLTPAFTIEVSNIPLIPKVSFTFSKIVTLP